MIMQLQQFTRQVFLRGDIPGLIQMYTVPVISSGKAFDVVRLPDGKLWPVINN